jgi:hypothetical protein
MIRYTVTFSREADAALAREWMNARNRRAVAQAGDEIDRLLKYDAAEKGTVVRENLRELVVEPLIALFTVDEGDRKVTVWSVRIDLR